MRMLRKRGWRLLPILLLLLLLGACGKNTAFTMKNDYTVGGVNWGVGPATVQKTLGRGAVSAEDGRVLQLKKAKFHDQAVAAEFLFADGVSGQVLNGVRLTFAEGYDKTALVRTLSKVLGPMDEYYTTESGDRLRAPEENWSWHTTGTVMSGELQKYLCVARFEDRNTLYIDATGANLKSGKLA